ncbi:glycosyltransferase family 4 protein [Desulfothermus okinawensis JCM 13304]
MKHYLIATDFFPKIGGAHFWIYNVYKNWPEKVLAIVQDYSKDTTLSSLQAEFDISHLDASLVLKRVDLSLYPPTILSIQNFFKVTKLNWLIKKSVNCVHILRSIPDGYFALFAKCLNPRIKLVVYAHGEEFLVANSSREYKLFTKLILKNADLIIANSFFTEKRVLEFFPKAKVKVFHLGVNFSDYQVPKEEVLDYSNKLGIRKNSVVLLTVARMEPRKNHKLVLEVLSNLIKEGHSIEYIVIGSGEEEKRIRELAYTLGIEDRVYFLGFVSEKEKILAFNLADIYIMPSIKHGSMIEGFGIVFLEAAAAGIPSIAGNVGGQPEAVRDGETGIVVNGKSREEVKDALRYLILNPEVRERMGKKGKKWAKQHEWKRISEKIYLEFLKIMC